MDTQKKTPSVQEMIEEMKARQGQPVSTTPVVPAEIDQDAGGGFNLNHTIPQP